MQWLRGIHFDLRLRGFNRRPWAAGNLRGTALLRHVPYAQ